MFITLLRAILSPVSNRGSKNTQPAGRPTMLEPKSTDKADSFTSTLSNVDVEAQSVNAQSPSERSIQKKSWCLFKPSAKTIKDATIGLSDGMTVPFALMAGLTTFHARKVVLLGGAAELIAGSISMAIGGFLGERAEIKAYKAAVVETRKIIEEGRASEIIVSLLEPYGVTKSVALQIYTQLEATLDGRMNYILHNHFGVSKPQASAPWKCALTIGTGYALGGFLPLIPYFFVGDGGVMTALCVSSAIMAVALFVFGYGKTAVVEGWRGFENIKSALAEGTYMLVIGGVATGLAVIVTRGINHGL